MAEILPGNGLQTTLVSPLSVNATTLNINSADAAKWPIGGEYRAVLCQNPTDGPWELVRVVAGQGTDTLTITRAVESYNGDQTAHAWETGTSVAAVITHDNLQLTAGKTGPQGIQGPVGPTGPQGPAGPGVPAGGTVGQVLTKTSATDYATTWQVPFVQLTQAAYDALSPPNPNTLYVVVG